MVFPWIVAIYFRERAAEREANQGLSETIFRTLRRFNPHCFLRARAPQPGLFFLRAGAPARAIFSGAQASQAGRFRA